jgi:hypothetical protein
MSQKVRPIIYGKRAQFPHLRSPHRLPRKHCKKSGRSAEARVRATESANLKKLPRPDEKPLSRD